ncbi:MAG: hypothetical protein ACOC5T_07855 [Elusimicrobiota bacterium]
MALIIGLSGKKQAGKNTVCDFLKNRILSEDSIFSCHNCKIYSFADPLKRFCIDIMGLTEKQCYGTDEEKNSLTIYKWDNLFFDIGKKYANDGYLPSGHMTSRHIMQVFGTDIMRNMFDEDIWVNATLKMIHSQMTHKNDIAFISDVRFPSEVNAVHNEKDGYIIRLTRKVFDDNHPSETALDDFDFAQLGEKCCIIDNMDMTIEEQNKIAEKFVEEKVCQE